MKKGRKSSKEDEKKRNEENELKRIEDSKYIIKRNIPVDIMIEILSFVEERELKYLSTFDTRCIHIKNDLKLNQRLMVKRLQRKLNPSIYVPINLNIIESDVKRGLKLFSDLPESGKTQSQGDCEEERIKWVSLYCGVHTSNTSLMEISFIEMEAICSFTLQAYLMAINLDKKKYAEKKLINKFTYSGLYYYMMKYGQEDTEKLLERIPLPIPLPDLLCDDEILAILRKKRRQIILDIIKNGDDELIIKNAQFHNYDPLSPQYNYQMDISLMKALRNDSSHVYYCYNAHSKDIPGFNTDWAEHIYFAACRDGNIDLLTSIIQDENMRCLAILSRSFSYWPIVDLILDRKYSLDTYLSFLKEALHPKILEKIARSAYKYLDINDYIKLTDLAFYIGRRTKKNMNLNVFPYSHIISIVKNIIMLDNEKDEDLDEIKERKEKERILDKRNTVEKKLINLYGTKCLWMFTRNSIRICEYNRTINSVYFCSQHSKYKGASKQEEIIDEIIENGEVYGNKAKEEMKIHLDKIKENNMKEKK